jgi:hypothetical protein
VYIIPVINYKIKQLIADITLFLVSYRHKKSPLSCDKRLWSEEARQEREKGRQEGRQEILAMLPEVQRAELMRRLGVESLPKS